MPAWPAERGFRPRGRRLREAKLEVPAFRFRVQAARAAIAIPKTLFPSSAGARIASSAGLDSTKE
jgi:hypothetical protein